MVGIEEEDCGGLPKQCDFLMLAGLILLGVYSW